MNPSNRALASELYETPLSAEEFERHVAELRSDTAEIAEMDALIAWFVRRYPTMEARLAYVCRHGRKLRAAAKHHG